MQHLYATDLVEEKENLEKSHREAKKCSWLIRTKAAFIFGRDDKKGR